MLTKRIGYALVVGVTAASVGPARAQEGPTARRAPEIVVSGTGTVTLSPDYAVVQVSVVTRSDQASQAGSENARLMSAVRAALKSLLRVPDDSLPTVAYSVDTEYDRGRPNGYQARSVLEAKTSLTQVGAAIDAALAAGATNISELRFESTKRESARLEALARAVQSAHREAEAIARASGGRLGALINASTTGPVAFAGPQMRAAMASSAETNIAPPSLEVSATVTARWAYVPE
jgi:uncharacterized protein YggE